MVWEKPVLRTPGPTPIPERVQMAMNQGMIGHRSSDFSELFEGVKKPLQSIFGTEQDVYVTASSGTSVLEMAVVNTLQAGDEAVVIVSGAFGDRFAQICEGYGIVTHRLDVTWGEACDPKDLQSALQQHPNTKAVIATYCETSTGVLHPIGQLANAVHQHSEALFIVDGVSCIGGVPGNMDAWGIDVFVTGSQKALMLPPGLGLISISDRAWSVIEANETPSFYFNLAKYRDAYQKGMTPFTPAISLINGLSEVGKMIDEEGLEAVFARHELMKKMTRSAVQALGLQLLTSEEAASPTVTAVIGGDVFNADVLRTILKEQYHISFAGGQKELKGKIMRIGHMGWCYPADVLTAVTYLELGLRKSGAHIQLGQGVAAAEEVYLKHV